MNQPIIPVFYACDDRFAKYTVVSLFSVLQNAANDRRYRVHILHSDLTEESKRQLSSLARENVEISFEDVTGYLDSVADGLPVRHYYTKTTYYRMFIAELFPQYAKALYLDSDTIVQGDISALYDTDLGDFYLGACHEQVMEQIEVYGSYCEQVVGVSRHNFFNAGVMLINCEQFRRRKIFEKFANRLGVYNFIVTQDEDYLNLICKDHVKFLDQRWNTEVCEGLSYLYNEREAYLLHYVMANKPWHFENAKAADLFWQYSDRTPVAALMRAELESYSDAEREKDLRTGEALGEMAKAEIAREDNYQKMLDQTVRAADRVAVVKKIAEFEREGKFDIDVEDDPPSRQIQPDEIDYLRTRLSAKLKTKVAYLRARHFLNYIKKHHFFIIREIRGIENLKNLQSGAVVTCNHFNAFDSFAMHEMYAASGHKKRAFFRVIREGNYTSFPGFYGFLMRHFYTLPLSSNSKTMQKFIKATDQLLQEGNFVLFYPEQSMWWNYRKPKPLKPGAYRFSVKNQVPVVPCFITMRDSDYLGPDGYPVQEYTITVGAPIYPQPSLSYKDNIQYLMDENFAAWKAVYEKEYDMPLEYTTKTEE